MRAGRRMVGGLLATSVCWIALAPGVATAAEPSVYAAWAVDGDGGSEPGTGTVTVPASGFPAGTITTTGVASPGAGDTAYLTEATPFGDRFGSSQGKQYAEIGPAQGDQTLPGAQPSTTTIEFGYPTPAAGWGFALGFVDDGMLRIEAVDAEGNAVDASGIGWRSGFSSCAVNPAPPDCANADVDPPLWEPTTMGLIGNGVEGTGPTGWFTPAVSLSSITFTYTPLTDPKPLYRLWIADSIATISGQVQLADAAGASTPYEGAGLFLLDADGDPVLDADGNPVATQSGPDGTYSFPGVARSTYSVAVDTPDGLQLLTDDQQPAEASAGDVSGVDFTFVTTAQPAPPSDPGQPAPPASPAPPAVAAPHPASPPAAAPGTSPAPQPELAATGPGSTTELTVAGVGLLGLGALLVAGARLRKH